jgi:membrane associated rhomboid family serine protease
MWFELILFIVFIVVIIFQFVVPVLPLGTEDSTFRRVPWVTFGILAVNVVVYFLCLPATVQQDRAFARVATELDNYIDKNGQILADERVRAKLREIGPYKVQVEIIEEELRENPRLQDEYKTWLKGPDATKMRAEIEDLISKLRDSWDSRIYSKYGVAGGGQWKPHQFITYAFLHSNTNFMGVVFPLHLFGNLLALFAIGMSLEDLWGRGTFLLFYLGGAVVAGIPEAMVSPVPLIGASGAVLATMGAFLVRLPHSKLKIGWALNPIAFPILFLLMMLGRKPFGIVKVKSYFYLIYFFATQMLFWWIITYKLGGVGGTSYRCHIAGFLFGAAFAFVLKTTNVEEKHINPKIEAKVSFSASPGVTQALEMLDKGEVAFAERKLKTELAKRPDDPNTMLALIQVYQKTLNYDQINALYGRLIRYHLAHHDKEAAVYAYDSLLSAFPDDHVEPRIAIRDWLAICDYLRESEMIREAAVEYERLVKSYPTDSLTLSACVLGGEAALQVHDNARALRLFETAEALRPGDGYASRVMKGLDNAKKRLEHRPKWTTTKPNPNFLEPDRAEHDPDAALSKR